MALLTKLEQEAYEVLLELCEWDAFMGGNENPVWVEARKVRDRLFEYSDLAKLLEEKPNGSH